MGTYIGNSGNNYKSMSNLNTWPFSHHDTMYGRGGNDSLYGNNGNDKIYGEDGNDRLYGGSGDDRLYGGAGNDWLDGGYGFDYIDGGSGIDTTSYTFYNGTVSANLATGVVAFPGNSTRTDTLRSIENIYTGNGSDTVTGSSASNLISTSGGNDRVYAGSGKDTVYSGSGNDYVEGGYATDTIYAGDGDDTIVVKNGEYYDNVDGGNGTDTLNHSQSSYAGDTFDFVAQKMYAASNHGGTTFLRNIETYFDGTGGNTIKSDGSGAFYGGGGNDKIHAGSGTNEKLDGGTGIDTLYTTHWNGNYEVDLRDGTTNYSGESFTNFENIVTGGGNDKVTGTTGDNSITLGSGNDFARGWGGNDTIYGGDGNDKLKGNSGHDTLWGGNHNDILKGGSGNDRMIGGSGVDRMNGNGGEDTFVFYSTSDSTRFETDKVVKFQGAGSSGGDVIDLSAIDANELFFGNQAFTFGNTGATGSVWAVDDGRHTMIYANTDGDASAEFALRILDGKHVTASDYDAGDFVL